jgi:hypothetical protein
MFDPAWPVHPDKLLHVVEAARWTVPAPGLPALDLVVVDDPAVLVELGEAAAPLLIVAVYDPARAEPSRMLQLGFGCVAQNLANAAHGVGLGFQLAEPGPQLASVLAIPPARELAFVARLGRPARTEVPQATRDLRDLIRWNRYS